MLYYKFIANFDGLKSAYCSEPPSEPTSSGRAVYGQGKRVINVHEVGDKIELEYDDMISKTPGHIKADIVIVADGSNSYVRGLLQPHIQHTYAGYIAWRSTVPEEKVARQTRGLLENKTTLHTTPSGYIALENGALEEGRRLFNFVWYTNLASDSQELQDAITDSDGNTHRHTLPIGKMQSKVWAIQRAAARSLLPARLCNLIDQKAQPFISSIADIDISRPSFYGGKLLFVGDSLVQFRPHVACSTNQAALDALLVEKLLKGEIDLSTWERQVLD
ncbi:hypothetical protein MMC13_000057 [Lambiella insularis]|nr:hypothetical protein [Lambiella insularis]